MTTQELDIPEVPPAERDIPVARAYPSQREAAELLGVKEARLSRSDFEPIPAGARSKHYPPRVLLEAAAFYRERSLNEVAGDLIAYATQHAPDHADQVRAEVEDFFGSRATPSIDREQFLEQARRTLPRRLYTQIKRAYENGSDDVRVNIPGDDVGTPARARTHTAG
ncbi:MAG: hypothetical protein ACLQBY_10255 [Solirubrobacteraceae bacterium]